MSKGMKFLNKKSWHTAKIQNIEQVWIAESKKKDEARKLLELKKQLDEERAVEGLRAVQAQSGLITSAQASRLDWMYTGAPVADAKTQEDYLTGKEKKLELDKEDVMKLNEKKAVGSLFLRDGVNVELEATNRLRDDPMTMIARQEHEARQHVLKNPVQMKQIKAKAELLEKLKKETAKRKKSERRDRDGHHHDTSDDDTQKKKKKKKRSKRSRSRSASPRPSSSSSSHNANSSTNSTGHHSNGSDSNDSATPAVAAAVVKKYGLIHSSNIAATLTGGRSLLSAPVFVPPPESLPTSTSGHGNHRNRNGGHRESRRSSRSRSRSRNRDGDRDNRSKNHSNNRGMNGSHSGRSRSRSRSRDRHDHTRRDNSRDRDHHHSTRPSSSSSSRGNGHGHANSNDNNGVKVSNDSNDARAAIARDAKKSTYQRRPVTSTKLSAAEMAAKLAAMQSTAASHDAAAIARMNDARIADKKEMDELLNRGNPDANPAKFVEQMNKSLYTSGEENIEDRLKKYSHYRQKGNTEHHSFMSR